MPRETTLAKVDAEIAAGHLGRARDRLLGLLSTFPDDLELRHRLGSLYWKLQDPSMAGKYWYLEAASSAEQQTARAAFEQRHGGHPARILEALKIRGKACTLATDYSRSALTRLLDQAGPAARSRKARAERASSGTRGAVLQYGCMLLLALWTTLAIVGLLSILESLG